MNTMRRTQAIISFAALRHNFQEIRRRLKPGTKILAMVKANAYGHGLIPCTRFFRHLNAEAVGVAYLDEALELRQAGDTGRIVVFTPPFADEAPLFAQYHIDCIISSEAIFHAFGQYTVGTGDRIDAHLYIDTGMHREGVYPDTAERICAEADRYPHLRLVGICTHFATAEEADKSFAQKQLSIFRSLLSRLQAAGFHFPYIHAANSAAIADLPESHFTMVRPGIALYGYNPSPSLHHPLPLQPALQLVTTISETRRIAAGEAVSYGQTYRVAQPTTIATLPIGYGDGLVRALSHSGSCLIRGKRFPFAGTICMDETMVDLGDAHFATGEPVVLLGESGGERITAEDWAQWAGTIPYEILVNIGHRVPRVYLEEFSDVQHSQRTPQLWNALPSS